MFQKHNSSQSSNSHMHLFKKLQGMGHLHLQVIKILYKVVTIELENLKVHWR